MKGSSREKVAEVQSICVGDGEREICVDVGDVGGRHGEAKTTQRMAHGRFSQEPPFLKQTHHWLEPLVATP